MIVKIVKTKVVEMSSKGSRRIVKAKQEDLCLGCLSKSQSKLIRGLCSACYQATLRLINSGQVSEESLLKNGKIYPKSKGGRPASNPVTIEAQENS